MNIIDLTKVSDPYNYCDWWCKRCLASSTCSIFGDEEEYQRRQIKSFKNPSQLSSGFELIRGPLPKVTDPSSVEIQVCTINLEEVNQIDKKEYQEYCQQQEEKDKRIQTHPLYSLAQDLEDSCGMFLRRFIQEKIGNNPDLQTIEWYSTLIRCKTYWALSDCFNDHVFIFDGLDDALVSFNICLRGVDYCLEALKKLEVQDQKYFHQAAPITQLLSQIKVGLERNMSIRQKVLIRKREENSVEC